MANLTDKQERFCQEYLVDLNATQAAIRAGYSPRTAGQTGHDNLKKPEIAVRVAELKEERAERTRVTADKVVKELARIAFTDMRSFVEWGSGGVKLKESSDLCADDSAAVTEVSESFGENGRTLKFRLGHKDSALKLLAQHLGLFPKEAQPVGNLTQYNFDFTGVPIDDLRRLDRLLDAAVVPPPGYQGGAR